MHTLPWRKMDSIRRRFAAERNEAPRSSAKAEFPLRSNKLRGIPAKAKEWIVTRLFELRIIRIAPGKDGLDIHIDVRRGEGKGDAQIPQPVHSLFQGRGR